MGERYFWEDVWSKQGSPAGMASLDKLADEDVRIVWADEKFLLDAGAGPWMEMPLWIPESDPEARGIFAFNAELLQAWRRAAGAGP